jgi:formamidopyrimidine-DNA glycosylase
MPELPDVTVYVEALSERVLGQSLEGVRLASPFLLRSAVPPISEVRGKQVRSVRRIGKRIVLELEDELFLALHLMIAGRLHWKPPAAAVPGKVGLAAFDFPNGTLTLTEAGTKRRAALHLVRGEQALLALADRGGLEVFDASLAAFQAALRSENHTLKRTLTDPTIFSGIGNSYSDEILHAARLSPVRQTRYVTDEEAARLYDAAQRVLQDWVKRLQADAHGDFPEKVTAFRSGMAVHGRFGQPCPVCGTAIQRIVHAENECNYCPVCQTDGKLLADRALSRLLKGDWPRTLEEMEQRVARSRQALGLVASPGT